MTDIVERLRSWADEILNSGNIPFSEALNNAAAEIERLRADNERLRAALHETQNLMCDVAQETRDVGLVEGETNARLQAYCKALKNEQGSASDDT